MNKRLQLYIILALITAWTLGRMLFSDRFTFYIIFFGVIIFICLGLLLYLSFRPSSMEDIESYLTEKGLHAKVKKGLELEQFVKGLFEKEKNSAERWRKEIKLPEVVKDDLRDLLSRRWAGDALEQDYINWAINALENGVDSPSLRILAGLNLPADRDEIKLYFASSLKELSIPEPDEDEIKITYFYFICQAMVKGTVPPERGIDLIHKKVVSPLDHPDRLMPWCYMWEGINPDSIKPNGSFAKLEGIERDDLILEYARKELEISGLLAATKFEMFRGFV